VPKHEKPGQKKLKIGYFLFFKISKFEILILKSPKYLVGYHKQSFEDILRAMEVT